MLRSDYASHDAEYRPRRANGYPGWNTPEVAAEQLALLEEVFAVEHFSRGGKLLELGCGAGDRAVWAAQRGYDVCGVEISAFAVEWARERAQTAESIEQELITLGFVIIGRRFLPRRHDKELDLMLAMRAEVTNRSRRTFEG